MGVELLGGLNYYVNLFASSCAHWTMIKEENCLQGIYWLWKSILLTSRKLAACQPPASRSEASWAQWGWEQGVSVFNELIFQHPEQCTCNTQGNYPGAGRREVLQFTAVRKKPGILQFLLRMMKCKDSRHHPGKEMKKGPTRISFLLVQQLAPETEGASVPALRLLGVCHTQEFAHIRLFKSFTSASFELLTTPQNCFGFQIILISVTSHLETRVWSGVCPAVEFLQSGRSQHKWQLARVHSCAADTDSDSSSSTELPSSQGVCSHISL